MPKRPPTLTEFLNGYYPQKVSQSQYHKDFLSVMYRMSGLVMYDICSKWSFAYGFSTLKLEHQVALKYLWLACQIVWWYDIGTIGQVWYQNTLPLLSAAEFLIVEAGLSLCTSFLSSSSLCRVFILIFLRQTVSLRNTVLQLFCCYYSRCLYHRFQCWIFFYVSTFQSMCAAPIWLFSVVPWLHVFPVCCSHIFWVILN